MNITLRYNTSGIVGIPYDELRKILTNQSEIKVNSYTNRLIVLSNGKLIKCAAEYFIKPENIGNKRKKMSNQCYYDQKDMDITGVANYRCVECFIQALEKKRTGKLTRKYR